MDQIFSYLSDIFQTSSFLSDYSGHIFVFILLVFGCLTYYLSIKNNNPIQDSPKISKKRKTKERDSKIKNDTVLPIKFEVTKDKLNEINDNETSTQEPKLKKHSKREEHLTNKSDYKSNSHANIQSCSKSNIEVSVDSKSIITSKSNQKSEAHKVEQKSTFTKRNKESSEMKFDTEREDESKTDVDNSESTTNSSADDFVFVGSSKSGEAIEEEEIIENFRERNVASGTSGASRKKNKKKHQQVKPSVVAEGTVAAQDDERDNEDDKSVSVAAKSSNTVKRRRPRKDN